MQHESDPLGPLLTAGSAELQGCRGFVPATAAPALLYAVPAAQQTTIKLLYVIDCCRRGRADVLLRRRSLDYGASIAGCGAHGSAGQMQ